MARVLISSLGVGRPGENSEPLRKYRTARYRFHDSDKTYETPFVASALIEHLQIEKLYLVGTSKSMWEEVYIYFSQATRQQPDLDYWTVLGERIDAFKQGASRLPESLLDKLNQTIDTYLTELNNCTTKGSRCLVIDYGLNEQELWQNLDVFMKIGKELKADDEVFLDITHGFRSIPLFNYILLDLIKILQVNNELKLGGLYYGMLDVISEIDYAPIVDLSSLYSITDWARGAYNFTNFGNGYLLAKLIGEEEIALKLTNISNIVNINYIDDFKREVDSLNGLLQSLASSDPVVKYMQPFLRSFIDRFKGINSSGELQLALARWYFDNKRFAQGYICLAESIITRMLEIYREQEAGISWGESNRGRIKNLLYKSEFKNKPEYEKVHKIYDKVRKIRNAIAHAGFYDGQDFASDIQNAHMYLTNVERHIFKNPAIKKLPELFPFASLSSS